ncbi:MAG: type II toxin-antitoxin system RelE/ParE family toxin [Gracilimonas sp.]|jgi:plasmid stabilization system protein ParE|uniref:type II toxin-antitoxin system RelE/ParE family toxin n=1 Tax=Gracilimonas sp. TaxID=1974203 RepID=UPI00375285E9|nr:type II toxin-antitoxin system RelE/ParE family toxin [Gracilimonas sp.]
MVTKTLVLTQQAEKDIDDAHDWYESQDQGLGKEFARCVDVKMASVLRAPHQYQVVFKNIVRRALVNRFPFSIYFVEQKDAISVFAILHQHRNPESWKSRV